MTNTAQSIKICQNNCRLFQNCFLSFSPPEENIQVYLLTEQNIFESGFSVTGFKRIRMPRVTLQVFRKRCCVKCWSTSFQ